MKQKINRYSLLLVCVSAVFLCGSCTSVKEYQKSRLNDAEMGLANRKVEKTELSFQTYREGSSGANGSKNSGGCGCN